MGEPRHPKLAADLGWIAVLISFWLLIESSAYVNGRAYYEDELMAVKVAQKDLGEIVRYTCTEDYHPPGYYLYLKSLFALFGERQTVAFAGSMGLTAAALVLLFLTYLHVGGANRLMVTALLVLNPMFLLHGSAARWYPLWTFLAAATVYLLTLRPAVTWTTLVICSLLVAAAAYVNYITAVLAAAIVVWLVTEREWKKAIVFVLIVGVLFAPWLPAFFTHATHSATQFMAGRFMRVKSFAYVGFCLLLGQTISPWSIVPWIAGLLALAPLILLHIAPATRDRRQRLIVLLVGMAMLFCLACRYQRARSLVFFSGALYLFIALACEKLRPRIIGRACLALLLGCNVLAMANMARGVHYHKKGLSDPVPEVAAQVDGLNRQAPSLALTTNLPLTYYLGHTSCPVESPYNEYLAKPIVEAGSAPTQVILIHTYLGSLYAYRKEYEAFGTRARELLGDPVVFRVKRDLDRKARQRIFGSTEWPEYRFTIEVYRNVKPEACAQVRRQFAAIWQDKRKPYVPSAEP